MFAPAYFAPRYYTPRYFPVGGSTAPPTTSAGGHAQHRFRSVIVPEFEDQQVQRFLQRLTDEIARAANPVRSVEDGGTGFAALEDDKLMAGAAGNKMQQVVIGEGLQLVDGVLSLTGDVVPPPAGGDQIVEGVDTIVEGADNVVES